MAVDDGFRLPHPAGQAADICRTASGSYCGIAYRYAAEIAGMGTAAHVSGYHAAALFLGVATGNDSSVEIHVGDLAPQISEEAGVIVSGSGCQVVDGVTVSVEIDFLILGSTLAKGDPGNSVQVHVVNHAEVLGLFIAQQVVHGQHLAAVCDQIGILRGTFIVTAGGYGDVRTDDVEFVDPSAFQQTLCVRLAVGGVNLLRIVREMEAEKEVRACGDFKISGRERCIDGEQIAVAFYSGIGYAYRKHVASVEDSRGCLNRQFLNVICEIRRGQLRPDAEDRR